MKLTPYRGTQDLYPERIAIRNHIFDVWQTTISTYSFEEYSGPLLESIDLYLLKTSEEIVNEQLYSLTDKKDRKLVIRPEMTPTLARMVANKAHQLTFPLRWYSIENCMRYERPQRGRFREFTQLNVDLIGGDEAQSDAEVLFTIPSMLLKFGAPESSFKVKINHRQLIDSFLRETISLDELQTTRVIRLLDAYKKRTKQESIDGLAAIGCSLSQIDGIINLMDSNPEEILSNNSDSEASHITILRQLCQLCDSLNENFTEKVFEIDFTILRGFDYYTGIVFEVLDTDPKNRRSLFGGGRYDNLIGDLGGSDVSGVGYGVSETSIFNFLEVHGLLPNVQKGIKVLASCTSSLEGDSLLDNLLFKLRMRDIQVLKLFGANKMNKILKKANKESAEFVVFIGPEEAEKGHVTIKTMSTGEETQISKETDFDSLLLKLKL